MPSWAPSSVCRGPARRSACSATPAPTRCGGSSTSASSPSAIAFTTRAFALSHADAGKFAQSTFLVPFITALMAWFLLDEVPPALAFLGGGLCIAGVLLTRRKSAPKA
ncbi:DMT family transporter [Nocardioides sp. B-3]|uniref:DMT family transporter n=1 Tax=Nocardioides sp. B-3 TaxID=2895565 RepID=UPI0021535CC5|nr:DMT family transporter [Nocardioides sp. B-3]UUZ57690.1 DMT family transporter [Nocardioides sp. B-3]